MKKIILALLMSGISQISFAQGSNECSQQMCLGSDDGRSFHNYCMNVSEDFWNSVDEWGPVIDSSDCYCPCKKYFQYNSTQK